MAFKLTYSDGQSTDYDDSTKWEIDTGVVKLGRDEGDWTVFVSPSHWATLELDTGKDTTTATTRSPTKISPTKIRTATSDDDKDNDKDS